MLAEYLQQQNDSLQKFYSLEDQTVIDSNVVVDYFKQFSACLPYFIKRYFRRVHFTYVLSAGDATKYIYDLNVSTGRVVELPADTTLDHRSFPIQIHTTAFIFLRGIEFRIFSHMCIGKRVFYKVTAQHKKYMEALNLVFNAYEYEMLPMKRLFTLRSLESWTMRWRELVLYTQLLRDKVLYGKIKL